MVIVLIRRSVKREKEAEFLATYSQEKPNHPDFLEETLTKVNDSTDLPEAMRSLPITSADCVTYLNVARWKSAEAFRQHFNPRTMHDPEIETSDRLRIVLEIVEPN
jgi:hypothetical protein